MIIHHSRKQSGRHGTGVRGSTALTGAVDVIAELDYGSDDISGRVLRFTSRFSSPPEPLAVVLDVTAGTLDAGDLTAAVALAEREKVLAALRPEWQGRQEIAESLQMRSARLRMYLDALVIDGMAERTGAGKKGDPYRFRVGFRKVLPSSRRVGEAGGA